MIGDKKIVEFEKYCGHCEFKDGSASSDPCNSCLSIPVREDSHKPIKFSEERKKHGE